LLLPNGRLVLPLLLFQLLGHCLLRPC
jgi:hypothetical protein